MGERDIAVGVWQKLLQSFKFLQRDIGARMRKNYNQSLARFEILDALSRTEESWLPVGQLAKQLPDPSGNISGLLDRMEKEGMVLRRLSPSDRRSFQVSLTGEGRKLHKKMVWDYHTWVASAMEDISKEERAILMRLLERMTESFGDAAQQEAGSRKL